MSISAMKQALEALERGRSQIIGALVQQDQDAAITALKQAIEQAEKQQPVAWMMINPSHLPGNRSLHWEPQQWHITWKAVPLYTAPVHASDISAERVDETEKHKHDLWIAAACLKSTVESAIKAGDWKVDGACDPTRDLAYLADCLANPKREWVGLTKAEFEEAVDGLENLEDCWQAIEAKLKEKNT